MGIRLEGLLDYMSDLDDDFDLKREFAKKVTTVRQQNFMKHQEFEVFDRFQRPVKPETAYTLEDKLIDILNSVNYTTWIPELSMLDLDDYAFLAQTPYFKYNSLHTVKTPSSEKTEPLS